MILSLLLIGFRSRTDSTEHWEGLHSCSVVERNLWLDRVLRRRESNYVSLWFSLAEISKHCQRKVNCTFLITGTVLDAFFQVTIEKNKMREDNSTLEAQTAKLQGELWARADETKPDLNVPPTSRASATARAPPGGAANATTPAVLIMPIHPDLPPYYPVLGLQVSKPPARYWAPVD